MYSFGSEAGDRKVGRTVLATTSSISTSYVRTYQY